MTDTSSSPSRRGRPLLGVLLIALGVLLLVDRYVTWFHIWDYWPLLLIVAGIGILSRARKT